MGATPRLRIGVPVYNGENFLADALRSIQAQTYAEIEIVISDNASTDATPDICADFARDDDRIRYVRHDENRGAGWNFEHVRALASGSELYKWAAHDDVLAPTFLECCVQALDERPDASLAFSGIAAIDDRGEVTRLKHRQLHASASTPHARFKQIVMSDANTEAVFGVIRTSALERSRGQGDYIGSDRVLLAELAIVGPFLEVPEVLLFNREHPARSVQVTGGDFRQLTAWFAPDKPEQFLPYWRVWREYGAAARLADLTAEERRRCLQSLPWYVVRNGGKLAGDVAFAARRVRRPWKRRSGSVAPV